MATPRVLGQRLRLTANLCLAREASVPTVSSCSAFRIFSFPPSFGSRTQERLVRSATTGNDTDHATGSAADNLLGSGGKLDTGLALIGVVADNGDVVAGGTTESATVTDLLLDVGDDGTLRNGGEGEDVADGQGGALSGVDELAGVHAFVGNEGLGALLELVGRVENNTGERGTTTRVVDDLLHNTTDVSMSLRVIEAAELGYTAESDSGVHPRAERAPFAMAILTYQEPFGDGCWQ